MVAMMRAIVVKRMRLWVIVVKRLKILVKLLLGVSGYKGEVIHFKVSF